MTEKEANKRLILLLQDLCKANNLEGIELLKLLIEDQPQSMKKSFEIMTELYFKN